MFLIEGGPSTGAGHISRSLALAEELQKTADVVAFVDQIDRKWDDEFARASISVKSSSDLLRCTPCYGGVIDGDTFSQVQRSTMRKNVQVLAEFCDGETISKSTDVLISPTSLVKPRDNQVALSGYQFAPIRSSLLSEKTSSISFPIEKVVVSCGWHDSAGNTTKILNALCELGFAGAVTVLIGEDAPNLVSLKGQVANQSTSLRVNLVVGETDTGRLLRQADFVIGTGGVSLLERIALGRPSITLLGVPNQTEQIRKLSAAGCTIPVEAKETDDLNMLKERIGQVIWNKELVMDMAGKGKIIVDGQGASRIARELTRGIKTRCSNLLT